MYPRCCGGECEREEYDLFQYTSRLGAVKGGLPSKESTRLPGIAGASEAELHGAEKQAGNLHAARTTEEGANAMNGLLREQYIIRGLAFTINVTPVLCDPS
jgi:hypothetical protein